MSNFVFTVNNVNLLPYIMEDGLKWTRFDVEAPDTGRTLDGVMHRGRVAVKVRLDVTCRPLTAAETATVLNAIAPEFVTVRYADPLFGVRSAIMYCNKNEGDIFRRKRNGTEQWTPSPFALVEK